MHSSSFSASSFSSATILRRLFSLGPSSSSRRSPSSPSSSPFALLLLLSLVSSFCAISQAYPAFYLQSVPRRHQQPSFASVPAGSSSPIIRPSAQKRAFDRLDVSPFDFDAMTKRFSDDELSALPFNDVYAVSSLQVPRKRAFDRLEDSGFFGLKKRAFDRLDNSFMLLKR